jgi:hypothetical protein
MAHGGTIDLREVPFERLAMQRSTLYDRNAAL